MEHSVQMAAAVVSAIMPLDDIEQQHISETLEWLTGTDDVYRRVKPATPPKHLVSYVAVIDPVGQNVFLVLHRNAGLWLPPGGHVEPDEYPRDTAGRELEEELGIAADFTLVGDAPVFLTVTTTVGADSGHVDVSLWYAVKYSPDKSIVLDENEFHEGRWWAIGDIITAGPGQFDPHMTRFLHKLAITIDAAPSKPG